MFQVRTIIFVLFIQFSQIWIVSTSVDTVDVENDIQPSLNSNLSSFASLMHNSLNESIVTFISEFENEKVKLKQEKESLQKDKDSFEKDKKAFESSKQEVTITEKDDIIKFNIAGEHMDTVRSTLTFVQNTTLFYMFNGEWDHQITNINDSIYLNYDPILFKHLLSQLRRWKNRNKEGQFLYPPTNAHQTIDQTKGEYNEMLKQLGFDRFLRNETEILVNTITYSQNFTFGTVPSTECMAWKRFTASLSVLPYKSLTLSGSNDPIGVKVVDPIVISNIAEALRYSKAYGPVVSNGRSWTVGECGIGYELSANGQLCSCVSGYTVRPCMSNSNFGGIDGLTCSGSSQTITVTFEY